MAPRKRQEPDTRPRWDDPNLPVMAYGDLISAEEMQATAMEGIFQPYAPMWYEDDTYFMRVNPKRRR